ncbi:MAG: SEL1-like repeat protein [Fibrobacterota bacterium]|nr:SEL1-like repeat protein [Fibrobacterota bacterium]QQS03599.1 MAG: SEL1-like repeat protein [Fibrobacterota bacterium]
MPRLKFLSWDIDPKIQPSVSNDFCHTISMIEYLVKPPQTSRCAKLIFHLVSSHQEIQPTRVDIDVLNQWCFLDENALTGPDAERRLMLSKVIIDAICAAATIENFETNPFIDATKKLQESSFKITETWTKWIPLESTECEVGIQWEMDSFIDLYFATRNRKSKIIISLELFLKTPLAPWQIKKILGKFEKTSESEITLSSKENDSKWIYNTSTKAVTFAFPRAEVGDGHGHFILGKKLIYGDGVLKNTEEGIRNIKIAASLGYPHAKNFLKTNLL